MESEKFTSPYSAVVPPAGGARELLFENNHQRQISAYLVNAAAPDDPTLRITAQNRNYEQSSYRLDYRQTREVPTERAFLIVLAVLAGTRFLGPSITSRFNRRPS